MAPKSLKYMVCFWHVMVLSDIIPLIPNQDSKKVMQLSSTIRDTYNTVT